MTQCLHWCVEAGYYHVFQLPGLSTGLAFLPGLSDFQLMNLSKTHRM